MSHATSAPPPPTSRDSSVPSRPGADLLGRLAVSKRGAGCLIAVLPLAGLLTSLFFGLPVFAALMTACLLLAAALTCQQAIVRITGRALRLLTSARLVLLVVLAALLYCATGELWMALVSALLLWLCSDRLLGWRTLVELQAQLRRPR